MHRELEDLVPYCPKCGYNLTGLMENRCPECGTAFDPITLLKQKLDRPGFKNLSVSPVIGAVFVSVVAVCVAVELFGPPGLLILVALFLAWLIYNGRREKLHVPNWVELQAGRPVRGRRMIVDKSLALLLSLMFVIAIVAIICVAVLRLFPFRYPFL